MTSCDEYKRIEVKLQGQVNTNRKGGAGSTPKDMVLVASLSHSILDTVGVGSTNDGIGPYQYYMCQ